MTEEPKDNVTPAPQAEEPTQAAAPKSNMMKYLIFGGAGLVLVLVVTVVAVMMLGGGDESAQAPVETAAIPAVSDSVVHDVTPVQSADSEMEALAPDLDLQLDDSEASVLSLIESNLDFLDYEPDAEEIGMGVDSDSVEKARQDSIDAANWLENEKAALAKREKELDKREKELNALAKTVNQKMLLIEQAESSRTAALAKLYDGMDPRSVARLMANLDDNTVVAIIPRMKQKNASTVLALLPPQRAAKLSKQMITIAEN
jgi:TolA-binding protein